jgi:hypothetical protein
MEQTHSNMNEVKPKFSARNRVNAGDMPLPAVRLSVLWNQHGHQHEHQHRRQHRHLTLFQCSPLMAWVLQCLRAACSVFWGKGGHKKQDFQTMGFNIYIHCHYPVKCLFSCISSGVQQPTHTVDSTGSPQPSVCPAKTFCCFAQYFSSMLFLICNLDSNHPAPVVCF